MYTAQGSYNLGGNGLITPNTAVAGGFLINLAHGLGGIPTRVRAVLVCLVNDGNLVVGDEIGVECFMFLNTVPLDISGALPLFSVTVNATNVRLAAATNPVGKEGDIIYTNPGVQQIASFNHFAAKIYASL